MPKARTRVRHGRVCGDVTAWLSATDPGIWTRPAGKPCAPSWWARQATSAWRVQQAQLRRCGRNTRVAAWSQAEGLALDPEVVLDPDTVERFVECALVGDGSRATYRSTLRRIGPLLTKKAPWEPRPTPVARRQVAFPYSSTELDGLRLDAACQPDGGTSSCGLSARGSGGWGRARRPVDHHGGCQRRLDCLGRGAHIGGSAHASTLCWCSPHGRTRSSTWRPPPVMSIWSAAGRQARNRASSLASSLVVAQGRPRFSAARLRSTWLATHLTLGTRLPELARAAGLVGVTVLSDLLPHIAPLDDERARRRLRGER